MNEDMKVICDVKEKVLDLLHQANKAPEFSMGDVDFLYKAIKAVKNAGEIEEMMDEDGYSQAGPYDGYEGGSSNANRGKHYDYSRNSARPRRTDMGRYSRDGARSEMMEHLEMALDSAGDEDRETIKRFMRQLEKA